MTGEEVSGEEEGGEREVRNTFDRAFENRFSRLIGFLDQSHCLFHLGQAETSLRTAGCEQTYLLDRTFECGSHLAFWLKR